MIGIILASFGALLDEAAMIIGKKAVAARRESSILWSVLSGNLYFHERHFAMKIIGFVFLAFGIVLLAL